MIRGLIASVPTPFSGDRVSGQAFSDHVAWLIKEGVDGIAPAGLIGEGSTLSLKEHAHVVSIAAEVATKRVPVIAATGRMGTDATIALSRQSKDCGANAALITVPFYNTPSQEGVFRHYEAIVHAVDLPIFIHNARSRTGVDLQQGTVARLAALPGIVGVIDDDGEPARELQKIRPEAESFLQFCGSDHQAALTLWNGAAGVLSSLANVVPGCCAALHRACRDHDAYRAFAIQTALDRFKVALGDTNEVAGLKWLLELRRSGFSRSVRLPLVELSDHAASGLVAAFAALTVTALRNAPQASTPAFQPPRMLLAARPILGLIVVSTQPQCSIDPHQTAFVDRLFMESIGFAHCPRCACWQRLWICSFLETPHPMPRALLIGIVILAILTAPVQAADTGASESAPATCKATLSFPAYGGLIKQNSTPACLTIGGLGDVYIGGALTGYGYEQSNSFPLSTTSLPSDTGSRIDFSNLQVFIQKPEGAIQLYAQIGAYASPGLGVANFGTLDQTRLLYGPAPVVYGKLQFNDDWSLQGGRMPTLIGTEAPFTFQNGNIERGLLFAQENVINQGVQLNYAHGPWTASLAGTDGFFAGEVSWLTGAVTYKVDDTNTVGVNGGLNLGRTDVLARNADYQYTTPLNQQNSGILDINYTYAKGPWTVTPYVQFTDVEKDTGLGIVQSASTVGGAVLGSYAFNENWGLVGRLEYEGQTGTRGSGTTSLLYGPGSSAFSATITPTYTKDRFFARGEYSHVELFDVANGLGFGRTGSKTGQDRFMAEGGITF